jgi:hypothetical protein
MVKRISGYKLKSGKISLQINGFCAVSRGGNQPFRDENPKYGTK